MRGFTVGFIAMKIGDRILRAIVIPKQTVAILVILLSQ